MPSIKTAPVYIHMGERVCFSYSIFICEEPALAAQLLHRIWAVLAPTGKNGIKKVVVFLVYHDVQIKCPALFAVFQVIGICFYDNISFAVNKKHPASEIFVQK